MVFFRNPEVKMKELQNLKKNHVTIMVASVMAAWKQSKMQFLCYFGALLLSKRLFSCQLGKKVILLQ